MANALLIFYSQVLLLGKGLINVETISQIQAKRPIQGLIQIKLSQRALRLIALVSLLISTAFLFQILLPSDVFPSVSRKLASSITTTLPSSTPLEHDKAFEYSVKPIVYIFPQFYPFKENNELWGENFTEWNNVYKVTRNEYGLETVRPDDSVGYYNGVDFHTRQRQGKFIRDNGFYGMVYHHYWFTGVPVMDGVLQAMLLDGEPNTPFMLSWANEPWTATWDGLDSSNVLIAQQYGDITDWRKHYNWLLPFFKHPNYIRSEGKVQFQIYKSIHLERMAPGLKHAMFTAWRKWAKEDGIGGIDILETRQDENPNFAETDAVSEFQPHAGGMNTEYYHQNDKVSRIYHRGFMVCWDSTPRHATDGRGRAWPTCHPKSWQAQIVMMLGRIKSTPNPHGAENFLFINALNEWGEGNVLEPSVQFGTGYGNAMKEAVKISKAIHIWENEDMEEGQKRIEEFHSLMEGGETISSPDVCILIRQAPEHGTRQKFPLDNLITSLSKQTNRNWQGIVFNLDGRSIKGELARRMEPRLQQVILPQKMSAGEATDFVLSNITATNPLCASAKYMLVSDGGNEYAPSAFEFAAKGSADFVAMNVESMWTVRDHDILSSNLCTRLEDPTRTLHRVSSSSAIDFSLPATFISLPKYLTTLSQGSLTPPYINMSLSFYPSNTSSLVQEAATMAHYLVEAKSWTWQGPEDVFDASENVLVRERHVLHNPSYTGCQAAGQIWVDSIDFKETGCYNTPDLGALYGGWNKVDLEFYRRHGICTKKKE